MVNGCVQKVEEEATRRGFIKVVNNDMVGTRMGQSRWLC